MQLAEPATVFVDPRVDPRLDPLSAAGWRARLDLRLERRATRTVLAERRHDGPLAIQKALYPEGDEVCHLIVLHPPAGIAGGDDLAVDIDVGIDARSLATTPGASKWYRSLGPTARQHLRFSVASGACLEWLPQETIVYDGARADMATTVRLDDGAAYLGWEIVCLGRTGAGERFTRGACRMHARVDGPRGPIFIERGAFDGDDALLGSPAGLCGEPVFGTLLACAANVDDSLVTAARAALPTAGFGSVTMLPGVLIARYLGPSTQVAKQYFVALWRILRPAIAGRAAIDPRIWST
ncbi:MAG: urease accessory protein UreD [Burkholderiales bacterium]